MTGRCAGCAALSRRQFVERSTLAAVAAFLAACEGDGGGDGGSPTAALLYTFNASSYPELAEVGGIARIDVAGVPVAVVRTGTEAFLAFSMICPHNKATVNISAGAFVCPAHGAQFDARGQWTGGQFANNLRSIPLTSSGDAIILSVWSE